MVRKKVGRKGFDLDYSIISQEYLGGKTLKELGQKYDVSQWTLLDNFKKLNVRKTTKRYQKVSVFETYTKESCYWAGFLAADGWTQEYSLGVELSSVDEEHLTLLRDFLQSNAEINRRTKINKDTGKEYEYSNMYFYSKELSNILRDKFNIVPNKSLIYQPPAVPEEFQVQFIRGYIDGDGSIGWHKDNHKPRLHFGAGSIEIVQWIRKIIEANIDSVRNPKLSMNVDNRKNTLYSTEYMGWQAQDILNWLYRDSDENTRLKRKYEDYLLFSNKLNEHQNSLLIKQQNKEMFIRELEFLYQSGMSSREIAKHLNIGQQKVLYNLRKSSIKKKQANNQNITGLERKDRDILMLRSYQEGKKPKEIALENNLALSSFWVAIRRAKSHIEV